MKEIESKYDNLFVPSAKLSFQTYYNLILSNKDLTLLHLISSVVSGGYFKGTYFYNSSFLSTKFSDIVFENCNLKSTDICSIWAKDCKFKFSDFSGSTISDSTFINCTFENSSFISVSLINCQFINCVFEQMPIDDSTVVLNTFTSCQIKCTHFTESFYYQIFNNCLFYNVNMSPDLLGYNFGFTKEFLKPLIDNIDLMDLETEFINRGLFINAAILHINLVPDNYDKAIIACITAINKMLQHDILIKADEIQFLKNLTTFLEQQNRIAPISTLKIWSMLNKTIHSNYDNTSINKALPHIREYINMMYFSFQHFLETLQQKLNSLSKLQNDVVAELKIIYYEKPSTPLLTMLTEFSKTIGPNIPKPLLIKIENGSFIEFHKIAVEIIPYVQTFFSILGVFTPIAIYYEQAKQHKREKSEEQPENKEKKEIEIKISTSVKPSSIILPNMNIVTQETNEVVANTIKILEKQTLVYTSGFSGYNPNNIQSITIRFQ